MAGTVGGAIGIDADEGDLIFVDPAAPPGHGRFAVVREEDLADAMFRQLIVEGARDEILSFETGHLGQAQAGLHGGENEGVIAPSRPSAPIRCHKHGIDLVTAEKADLFAGESFARDGEHSLDLCRMSRQFESRVSKEGVDCGESQIAASNTQLAAGFKLFQEPGDQRGVDLLEVQAGRRPIETLLRERQELTERVPIGTDGVGARLALLHQALSEEALQQGSEARCATHDRPSQRRSSRRMASPINSGEASRYQCVSAMCT